jgi:hypothetical protein
MGLGWPWREANMTRCRRWIAMGVVLIAVACGAAPWPAGAAEKLPHATFDVREAPLEDVLKVLFRDTPYTFELAPGKYARITMSLTDVPWHSALRAILGADGLVYAAKGNTYHISRPGASVEAAPPAAQSAAKPVHTMVYLSQYGDRTQLCLRAFPYPGSERVLWESRPDEQVYYYFPSPSFDRVLLVTEDRQLLVFVPYGYGDEQTLLVTAPYLLWKDDDDLIVLDFDQWQQKWVQGVYDIGHAALTPTGTPSSNVEALKAQFASQIHAVTDLVNSDARFGIRLKARDVPGAVLGSAGIWWGRDLRVPRPVAAVAPDGKHVALSAGDGAVLVITRTGTRSYVASRTLSATQLLRDEAVRFQHLRWSPDSKYLTFTETHYYPAQYYAPDIGRGYQVPANVTSLVRLYDLESDDVQTVMVGENAFLAPEGVEFQPGR